MTMTPRQSDTEVLEGSGRTSDFRSLLNHIQENPVLWVISVVFVALCALAAVFYRAYSADVAKSAASAYAEAMDAETPAERVEKLDAVASDLGALTAEALYMKGESAYRAALYDKAKEAYTQLREKFPDYPFTPDAVEGLGYIAENDGALDEAKTIYQDVLNTWPASFAARRQHLNLGRVAEAAGNLEEARDAYRAQLEAFPGSNVANHAQDALDRMRFDHPEVFPEEQPADTMGEITVDSAPVTITPAEGDVPDVVIAPEVDSAPVTITPAEGDVPDVVIAPEAETSPEAAPAEAPATDEDAAAETPEAPAAESPTP